MTLLAAKIIELGVNVVAQGSAEACLCQIPHALPRGPWGSSL